MGLTKRIEGSNRGKMEVGGGSVKELGKLTASSGVGRS